MTPDMALLIRSVMLAALIALALLLALTALAGGVP